MKKPNAKEMLVVGLETTEEEFDFTSSIETARAHAEAEIVELNETIQSVSDLQPDCDKLDYALAASAGVLCGLIDVFLVGKPGESPVGDVTDKWFAERTKGFAKLCGWGGKEEGSVSSAMRFLEKKFAVPYDQRGLGDAISDVLPEVNTQNHHFMSLGHNPTLLGLFFSILDQFCGTSHFVSPEEHFGMAGVLIDITYEGPFQLRGNSVPAKFFCAFFNWLGHLISDVSGSSSSKGRGMGIPSPLWAWTNDIIAIKRSLNLDVSKFDTAVNKLALETYQQGDDLRSRATQAIPVVINEILVRLIYSIRRLVKYFSETQHEERSLSLLWERCKPFSNPTVNRMLTVAHFTFCVIDVGDATIRAFVAGGGHFNAKEFVLRLNIVGIGRFAISLFTEANMGIALYNAKIEAKFAARERTIVEDYLGGLATLSDLYNDKTLLNFIEAFKNSDMYVQAFEKSAQLAELRKVPDEKILKSKADIDSYFGGRKNE